MYSIGQISLILKISTRMLRHYDEIGLLKPSFVDKESNYRYYDKDQINIGKQIINLKETGLSLEEIKEVLANRDNNKLVETIEKRLILIEEEIKKLNYMKSNLNLLKKSNVIAENDKITWDLSNINIVKKDEIHTISRRTRMNIKDIGKIVGSLHEEINRYGLKILGGHIIRYYDTEYDPENADVEVMMPVERRKESKVKFINIPAGRYARAISDSISDKGYVHAMIIDWLETNNCEINGLPMEQYSIMYETGKFIVEILYPIK